MHNLYLGIDPGSKGYITIYNNTTDKHIFFEFPKIGKLIDEQKLDETIKEIKSAGNIVHCVTEDVHAIYGSAASSTWKFGYVCGILMMCLVSNKIPFTKIQPKAWQKEMWMGVPIIKKPSSTGKTFVNDTKAMSAIAAQRLFPNLSFKRTDKCKNDDDNLIDSLLLSTYCYRHFKL